MKKTLFALCLLVLCAYSGRAVAQTESTSTATITFFRTPSALLPGQFSVSATKKARFAKGNLQYLASQNKWRFAANQWEAIGANPGNNTSMSRNNQSNWIDLFAWGTSGWSGGGNSNYQPWTADGTDAQYGPAIGTMAANASWSDAVGTKNYDWGTYIFNDGPNKGYRVLTKSEWNYIFSERTNAAALFGMGRLHGVNGLYILPDNWDWSKVSTQTSKVGFVWTPSSTATDFTHNIIPETDAGETLWAAMETLGAVFLPCGGYRSNGGTNVKNQNASFHYWTSTAVDANDAYVIRYNEGNWTPNVSRLRSYGFSVRLVQIF